MRLVTFGYHATELAVAHSAVVADIRLGRTDNEREWLGEGIYLWLDHPAAAIIWAMIGKTDGRLKKPAILRYDVNVRLCLDVNDTNSHAEIRLAFNYLEHLHLGLGKPLPTNDKIRGGIPINRFLDSAVINTVDYLRRANKLSKYDSVMGMFEDGQPIFPGSAIKDKTHRQIAIRNADCLSNPTIVWQHP